jgi:hypothetical protein
MSATSNTQGDAPLALGRDRGAALVEAAIALPVCVLLFFGMIAAGSMMKLHSSVANAVRSGGRMASVAGADPMSDKIVLARMAQEAGAIAPDPIEYLVIWHASGPGSAIPPACVPATHATPNVVSMGVSDGGIDAVGACNIYVRPADPGGAFDMALDRAGHPSSYYFGCEGTLDPQAAHKVDCRWPGKDRRAVTTARAAVGPVVPPDFVGVHLRVDHHLGERLFGALTITDSVVNLIEPRGYGS